MCLKYKWRVPVPEWSEVLTVPVPILLQAQFSLTLDHAVPVSNSARDGIQEVPISNRRLLQLWSTLWWALQPNNCRLLCRLLVILKIIFFCKQCGPRSDCSRRSSLIRVHTVCLYAKICLNSLQEYSADDVNRRHFQMQVFLARLTFLREKVDVCKVVLTYLRRMDSTTTIWTGLFPIAGCLVCFLFLICFIEFPVYSVDLDQTLHFFDSLRLLEYQFFTISTRTPFNTLYWGVWSTWQIQILRINRYFGPVELTYIHSGSLIMRQFYQEVLYNKDSSY